MPIETYTTMILKNADDLLIKGKILILAPENSTLSSLNNLIIRNAQNLGFFQIDTSLSNSPLLFFEFLHGTLHPFYLKPTTEDKIRSLVRRTIFFWDNNAIRTPYLVAFNRTLKSIHEEVPFRMSIKITPITNFQFELDITLYPVLFQLIDQWYIRQEHVDFDFVAPKLLSYNARLIDSFSTGVMGKIIEKPHFINIRSKQQIFISHSKNDNALKDFVNIPISMTHVKAIYEEYEGLSHGKITRQKIISDINECAAVFVLFSKNVNEIPYTRDWVAFESGYAAALQRDVWVLEQIGYRDNSSLITPGITDYFPFDVNNTKYLKHLIKIIQNYDVTGDNKLKLVGIPYVCSHCHTKYSIHPPEDISYSENFLKCPVCNELIDIKIEFKSKLSGISGHN